MSANDAASAVPNLSVNHPDGRPTVDLYSQPLEGGLVFVSSNERSILFYGSRTVFRGHLEVMRDSTRAREVELIEVADRVIRAATSLADRTTAVVEHINTVAAPTQWVHGITQIQVSGSEWVDEIDVFEQPQGILTFVARHHGGNPIREVGGGNRHQFGQVPPVMIEAMFEAKHEFETTGATLTGWLVDFFGGPR